MGFSPGIVPSSGCRWVVGRLEQPESSEQIPLSGHELGECPGRPGLLSIWPDYLPGCEIASDQSRGRFDMVDGR